MICFLYCVQIFSQTGSLIVLQGTSSAGKSSIAQRLQTILPCDWSIVALDTFLGPELVSRAVQEGLIIDGMSELECQKIIADHIPELFSFFDASVWRRIKVDTYAFVAKEICAGRHIILDTVLQKDEFEVDSCFMTHLKNFPVSIVLVYCSPFHLVEHTNIRNDCGDFTQTRDLDRVLQMFCDLYVPVSCDQDEFVDQLIEADMLDQRLRDLFGTVSIKPSFGSYDCIVNTGLMSVQACAERIAQLMVKKE